MRSSTSLSRVSDLHTLVFFCGADQLIFTPDDEGPSTSNRPPKRARLTVERSGARPTGIPATNSVDSILPSRAPGLNRSGPPPPYSMADAQRSAQIRS